MSSYLIFYYLILFFLIFSFIILHYLILSCIILSYLIFSYLLLIFPYLIFCYFFLLRIQNILIILRIKSYFAAKTTYVADSNKTDNTSGFDGTRNKIGANIDCNHLLYCCVSSTASCNFPL